MKNVNFHDLWHAPAYCLPFALNVMLNLSNINIITANVKNTEIV